MTYKNKNKKDKVVNDKAIIAIVTKEMARPRMTESARIELHKQNKAKVVVSACNDSPFTVIV
jgi:hypothetical protein